MQAVRWTRVIVASRSRACASLQPSEARLLHSLCNAPHRRFLVPVLVAAPSAALAAPSTCFVPAATALFVAFVASRLAAVVALFVALVAALLTAAVAWPRAVPAALFAALSPMLINGFFIIAFLQSKTLRHESLQSFGFQPKRASSRSTVGFERMIVCSDPLAGSQPQRNMA